MCLEHWRCYPISIGTRQVMSPTSQSIFFMNAVIFPLDGDVVVLGIIAMGVACSRGFFACFSRALRAPFSWSQIVFRKFVTGSLFMWIIHTSTIHMGFIIVPTVFQDLDLTNSEPYLVTNANTVHMPLSISPRPKTISWSYRSFWLLFAAVFV